MQKDNQEEETSYYIITLQKKGKEKENVNRIKDKPYYKRRKPSETRWRQGLYSLYQTSRKNKKQLKPTPMEREEGRCVTSLPPSRFYHKSPWLEYNTCWVVSYGHQHLKLITFTKRNQKGRGLKK